MNEENNLSEGDKKAILRSAAYPNITIEEALEIVSQIKRSFPSSQFDRDDVAAILKRTNITRDIGAAVQYGLLVKTMGQGYKLAERVKSILNFLTEEERTEALIECFKTPKLYIDLIERFRGHAIPSDQQLRSIVIRYHGITEAAAPQAMDIFVQNAIYCGVMNENRILLGENTKENNILEDKKTIENTFNISAIRENTAINEQSKNTLLLQEINNSVNWKIYLSEKKVAHLIYPADINERDIQILKLQIDALALTL